MPTTINTPRESTFKTTEQTPRNIADVLADELSGIAQALGGSTDYDDLSHRPQINSVTLTGDKSADDLSLAMQEDLTSIKATGTTNATGSTITSGTFFYLNGTLCKAKSDIASGATFTLNTNYEVVTAGGLNSLNSAIADIGTIVKNIPVFINTGTSTQNVGTSKFVVPYISRRSYLILCGDTSCILYTGSDGTAPVATSITGNITHTATYNGNNSYTVAGLSWWSTPVIIGLNI